MNKNIFFCMLSIATMLVSCSDDETLPEENGQPLPVTFNITTDKPSVHNVEDIPALFVVEAYKKDSLEAPYARTEGKTGTLTLDLPKGEYTCLFWADNGEGFYRSTDLKDVKGMSVYPFSVAYCLKQDITVTDDSPQNILLRHAVAAIRLIDTKGISAGKMMMGFAPQYMGYNVMEGKVVGHDLYDFSNTWILEATTGETTLATLYAFAPANEPVMVEVKYALSNYVEEKIITDVPVQSNHQTLIKGALDSEESPEVAVTTEVMHNH